VRVFAASTSIGGHANPWRIGIRSIERVPFHFVEVPTYRGNGLGRLRNILAFNRRVPAALFEAARTTGEKPDLIIGSSPQPFAWPAVVAAARSMGSAFIPEVRDLWPESLLQLSGLAPWHPMVMWSRHAERIALDSAVALMSPLAGIAEAMRGRCRSTLHCLVVPNGVSLDGEAVPSLEPDLAALIDEATSQGRRVLLYAGAMGIPNALDQFIEALERLPAEWRKRISVLMVGDGTERERLELRACEAHLPMHFAGQRTQEQVRALCRACDAGFVGWLDRPLYRFGTASQKRALMLGEGLPLVHATSGGHSDEQAAGTGWTARAGDAKGIEEAIRSFLSTSPAQFLSLRAACEEHARLHLDWDRIAGRAWNDLLAIVRHRPRGCGA
jgi:glycosyltransferase involved in cell wall biosynthesis